MTTEMMIAGLVALIILLVIGGYLAFRYERKRWNSFWGEHTAPRTKYQGTDSLDPWH